MTEEPKSPSEELKDSAKNNFFNNSTSIAISGDYRTYYNGLVQTGIEGFRDDIIEILTSSIKETKAKNNPEAKDEEFKKILYPEYFFKFLALIGYKNKEIEKSLNSILSEIKPEIFDEVALIDFLSKSESKKFLTFLRQDIDASNDFKNKIQKKLEDISNELNDKNISSELNDKNISNELNNENTTRTTRKLDDSVSSKKDDIDGNAAKKTENSKPNNQSSQDINDLKVSQQHESPNKKDKKQLPYVTGVRVCSGDRTISQKQNKQEDKSALKDNTVTLTGIEVEYQQKEQSKQSDNNKFVSPLGQNTQLVGAEIEYLGNKDIIEDHLYFNSKGEIIDNNSIAPSIISETVNIVKSCAKNYKRENTNNNSFEQEESKKAILESMSKVGAETCAFVCASDNPEKPNQKIVDCVTFGNPSIRLKLTVKNSDGKEGILYYYPNEKKLKMLGEDKKEFEVDIADFPNIAISDTVRYSSLSNEMAINKKEESDVEQTHAEQQNTTEEENIPEQNGQIKKNNALGSIVFDGSSKIDDKGEVKKLQNRYKEMVEKNHVEKLESASKDPSKSEKTVSH